MLAAILQAMFQFVMKLGAIFGLAFMVICTVLVLVCVVSGDVKINITRSKAEKENE
ncbi:MAG: hypothetical protein K2H53_07380 [Clostridia bacterium]|nr:hypothetical protein [Clostridia bacterium]